MVYQEDVNVNLNILAGAMGGVTAIMGSMSALTSTFSQMGTEAASTFGSVDAILVGATAMIAAFGVESANAFGEYEQGMKIVQTVSGQSSAAISELGAKANELSVAYRTSIGDITDGLQTLGRAGLNSANEQVEVLESGLQTAKLEGRNLNGVLEEIIQNTAMLGGDLKSVNFGEQAEYLNSLMVGTSMTAPIDSHDISQTLQYAGGTAAAAGANLQDKDKLEDLMGTIAAFAQKGVSGSMAGTALRAFFTKPASQDKMVTAGLESIGLTPEDLWEDGGESMREVSDQIAIIQGQMDKLNLSTMDQVEVWGKIVGAKMGQQMMKLDSSTIKDLTRDIQGAQSAEALSAQTLQTYTQQISEFQQQGEVAFREFGEKVVRILTPIVEIGTWIMQFFSNPIANTGLFIGAGALFGHGLSRAWGMLKAIYGEVRNVINEAREGIASINALAGGSAPGFQQSASQVDYLNAKLHETDSTLQAIQAKALGVKPGYMIPGGLAGDKIPRDTLRIMEENVIQDVAGVMGGKEGQYYSGEKKDLFDEKTKNKIQEYKDEIAGWEEQFEQVQVKKEERINELTRERQIREEQITQEYRERANQINKTYSTKKDDIKKKYGEMYGQAPDSYTKASIQQQYKDEIDKLDNETNIIRDISAEKGNSQLAKMRSSIDNQIKSVERTYQIQENAFNDSVARNKDEISKLEKTQKQGLKQLQTRLEVNSVEVAEKWFADLEEKEKFGTITESERYSLDKTRELWTDYQNQYAIGEMEKEGVLPTLRSRVSEQLSPRDTMLAQIFESGDYKEMAQAKRDARENAAAVFAGQDKVSYKASKNTEARLKSFEDRLRSAGDGLSRFKTSVSDAVERRRRPSTYVRDNAFPLQNKGKDMASELNLAGKGMTNALEEVRTKLNISASDFAAIFDSETLSAMTEMGPEMEQLANQATNFRDKLIESIAVDVKDVEEREKVIIALRQEYDAHMKAAAASGGNVFGGTGKKATGIGGKFLSTASAIVDFMGGPLMAGMMGIEIAMQAIQENQRQWQERMQKADSALSEAEDKLSTSTDNVRSLFNDEGNSISEASLEKIQDYQFSAMQESLQNGKGAKFSDMYDNEVVKVENLTWTDEEKENNTVKTSEDLDKLNESMETISLKNEDNIEALKENTVELHSATYAYSQALGQKAKEMGDGVWGLEGFGESFSDDEILESLKRKDNGFLDNYSPVLKASQEDQNYPGSTDWAPIMAENFRLAENNKRFWQDDESVFKKALEDTFGNDTSRIVSLMQTRAPEGYSALQRYGEAMTGLSPDKAMLLQASRAENKEDYQKLGKQMFRYEQQFDFDPNRGAIKDNDMLRQGIHPTATSKNMQKVLGNRDLKSITSGLSKAKLTVQDKNLRATIDKLMSMTGNKLEEGNILAMGQLQQLQDMGQIAQEQIAPNILKNVEYSSNILAGTYQISGSSSSTSGSTGVAANNTAIIATTLGAQAQGKAEETEFAALQREGLSPSVIGSNIEEFRSKVASGELPRAEREIVQSLLGSSYMLNSGDMDPDSVKRNAKRLYDSNSGFIGDAVKYQAKLNTATWGIFDYAEKATQSAYDQSQIGEYGSNSSSEGSSGGSGGSGSGSDSGDKDNSGTKKERVDLVLCNKKEIPKLNVNLFKKAPNFTVLNKNFRLRDIKINSQDKPKAILDAIKNGIIDTQKRMDPKIIQDDTAEYNPVEATDGSSTPSGTTKTTT